jgi:hypothetical protein
LGFFGGILWELSMIENTTTFQRTVSYCTFGKKIGTFENSIDGQALPKII